MQKQIDAQFIFSLVSGPFNNFDKLSPLKVYPLPLIVIRAFAFRLQNK